MLRIPVDGTYSPRPVVTGCMRSAYLGRRQNQEEDWLDLLES
jgi:hypothetical protein